MIDYLPNDYIEMRSGQPNRYMEKIKDILNTSGDSDIGYFFEVDLLYPEELKQKNFNFSICTWK